ncbi:hypothetical protein D3D02_06480 [Halobellus sp. Atlit-38R]|jgi:hypothetical protein|uniref:hypothetical protein n=1 Tax=Halobellus sp. Atlit-38R TaxID=2282131 RepID=UPI000EF20D5D|nr:hypothetical protein [Halobellus sp. Atlit-38R]RLM90399.1 hypothetical protein D3D02_06480 [Halobellus sp. Atlit-38R]
MPQNTSDTLASLLESVIEDTDGADVHFKLRTALQLLDVVRVRNERISETLSDVDLDDDLEERLRELGYVE